MVFALDGPMPLMLSSSVWVAVFTLIGEAAAKPETATNTENTKDFNN
jgi:hypothetical protein